MKTPRVALPFVLLLTSALSVAGADEKDAAKEAGPTPSAEEVKAYEELIGKGVLVQPIAANLNWRYINFRGVEKPDPSVFAALKQCSLVQDLDLSGVKLTDADLASIAGLKNLLRLNLARSGVNDAGLAHLKGLEQLTVLNLFQTEVTDAGVAHLHPLKNLRRLYVFETKVTDAGVSALQQALPELKIERGWQVAKAEPEKKEESKPQPAKPEEKKEPAKEAAPKADAPKPEEKKEAPKPDGDKPAA